MFCIPLEVLLIFTRFYHEMFVLVKQEIMLFSNNVARYTKADKIVATLRIELSFDYERESSRLRFSLSYLYQVV